MVPFGHVRTDDGEYISQDAVRDAFNSPFSALSSWRTTPRVTPRRATWFRTGSPPATTGWDAICRSLPYTAEIEAFDRLKRQPAAYRVVFGQPRQEELVTLLDRAGVDVARLRDWAVDLSPLEGPEGTDRGTLDRY